MKPTRAQTRSCLQGCHSNPGMHSSVAILASAKKNGKLSPCIKMTGDSLVRQPPETPRGLRRPGQRPAVSTTKPACLSHSILPWKLHWACAQVIPVSPGICDFFSYYPFSSQEARFVCRQAEGKGLHKSWPLMDSPYLSKTQIGLCQACTCPLPGACSGCPRLLKRLA